MVDERFVHPMSEVTLNIAHLSEECAELILALGEVVHACSKTLRWGLDSVDPTIPPGDRVTNAQWIKTAIGRVGAEMADFRFTSSRVHGILTTMEDG